MTRILATPRGPIALPAVFPVTTCGDTFPIDRLVRPYLARLAPAILMSYHYAQDLRRDHSQRPDAPLIIDSGGFGLLAMPGATWSSGPGGARICFPDCTTLDRNQVLQFQQDYADVGCTLDIPIPPGTDLSEAQARWDATLANADWALHNCQRRDFPLLASIQAWDAASAGAAATRVAAMSCHGTRFAGIAIGGLVPRLRDRPYLESVVRSVRAAWDGPIHVFGIGEPTLVRDLLAWGADSTDTSTYIRQAIDGRSICPGVPEVPAEARTPLAMVHLALRNYLAIVDPAAAHLPLNAGLRMYRSSAA